MVGNVTAEHNTEVRKSSQATTANFEEVKATNKLVVLEKGRKDWKMGVF